MPEETEQQPDCFVDLSLDKVTAAITKGLDEYNLAPLFYTPLTDPEAVQYRQAVFTDLGKDKLLAGLREFISDMKHIHARLRTQARAYNTWQRRRLFLNAALAYCRTVTELDDVLTAHPPDSAGLRSLAAYLTDYISSSRFDRLRSDAAKTLEGLNAIRYCVLLRSDKITVEHYDGEATLTEQVLSTFDRFRQAPPKDYHTKLPHPYFDQIAAFTVDLVASLYPAPFEQLEQFSARHDTFIDDTLERIEREIQFYLATLASLAPLQRAGLHTAVPKICARGAVAARETFDLALAADLIRQDMTVVTNDVELSGTERILVVSGPNQGGKTTLARTVGQLHYLAALGCPVPGRDVSVAIPDAIFTQFERQEDLANLAGKLENDLLRIKSILDRATGRSLVVLNEIFTSTTLEDARFLSKTILETITKLDATCVCVTFIDELSRLNEKTVSMVSVVHADDPAIRTFKVVRRSADGRAYAMALARKYGLTYQQLADRVRS